MVWSFFNQMLKSEKETEPSAPPGERIYAIGDVHGRADLLRRLLNGIRKDMARADGALCRVIFLGDYVDRGPQSKETLDILSVLPDHFEHVHFLKGNHEEAMLNFLDDPFGQEAWLDFGGVETLESYGVAPPMPRQSAEALENTRSGLEMALPETHMAFLEGLNLTLTFGDYFFVHAGVRPGVALEDQVQDDLLWIREEFLSSDWAPGKIIIHGHTPREQPVIGRWRIGVDTGAYATGRLTCVVLEGTGRRFLSTQKRRS